MEHRRLAVGRALVVLLLSSSAFGAADAAQGSAPAVASKAPLLVYQSKLSPTRFDISTARMDGSDARNLTHSKAYDADPAWSPDGHKIVFRSERSGRDQIWVMNADGRGLRRLTHDSVYDFQPAWSPNGKRIAFVRSPDGRLNYRIWVMRADGTHQRRLSRHAFDWYPSWTPDSRHLVFTSTRSRSHFIGIYTMKANGSGARLLSGEDGIDSEEAWCSPNGRWIAFMRSDQLWVMNADGSNAHPLTPYPEVGIYDTTPHWSPDSSHIVFATERFSTGDFDGLAVIGVDGSGMTGISTPTPAASPDWRP